MRPGIIRRHEQHPAGRWSAPSIECTAGGPTNAAATLSARPASKLLLRPLVELRALIFDIDGTLVDSNDLHTECWLEAFARYEKEFDYQTIRTQMGKGGDLLVPDLLNAREMRTYGAKLQKERAELFKKEYLPRVRAFPAIRDSFEALRARGITLALASSSGEEEVKYYTGLLGVAELIDGSTSKKDAEFSKPSPEIFRAALERIGSDDARTMTVGDTPYDIIASHRVPLPVVAVRSGGFPDDQLAKAEFLFADVRELVRKIDDIDAYFHE